MVGLLDVMLFKSVALGFQALDYQFAVMMIYVIESLPILEDGRQVAKALLVNAF